ncbi:hypothetical protein C5B85_13105 [Pseudoclavibacter sp. AY1F1]|uniref:hypothetical protein n=1 Tax=Pseudoclavibacter sp. AY1F1 TaxID=2080583 RepID=UPI000CE84690|nr:hypothetical protein [Pseudoclavibacter sp. AY1F1]PPF43628.1 hypothetical protein C5B85_13105 [Pseudoclavibacter sp. AY1F1]
MIPISALTGYELDQSTPGVVVLEREGVPLGFIVDVEGVHVVLRGARVDTGVEISQHVQLERAIESLVSACCEGEAQLATRRASSSEKPASARVSVNAIATRRTRARISGPAR